MFPPLVATTFDSRAAFLHAATFAGIASFNIPTFAGIAVSFYSDRLTFAEDVVYNPRGYHIRWPRCSSSVATFASTVSAFLFFDAATFAGIALFVSMLPFSPVYLSSPSPDPWWLSLVSKMRVSSTVYEPR